MKKLLLAFTFVLTASVHARTLEIASQASLNNPGDSVEVKAATDRALARTISICLQNKKADELFKEMDNVKFEHIANDSGDIEGINVKAKCIYKK